MTIDRPPITLIDHASRNLPVLRDFLHEHLFGFILPFWTEHAIDPAGGINTCIADDGTLISRDKWLWSQWRAVWVFAILYNEFGRDDRWRNLAEQIAAFCIANGWNDQQQAWQLRLSGEGEVLDGCKSIYSDGFAIYGLTQLAIATGRQEYVDWARRTADSVLVRLQQPHDQIPHFPYPIPASARVHGLPMIFSLIFWELGQSLDEERYRQAALAMSDEIFDRFYRPDRDLILERISVDGSEYPPPAGTAVVPGHVIEDMWFQIHIARDRNDQARMEQCCHLIRRHMELGWDRQEGGLFLAVDADGRDEIGWDFADTKVWWPHTECLYALLLAHELTGESWSLDWYDKVHAWSFRHHPDTEHGEWIQKLDRQGRPFDQTVALPVKDPFHLPRALIYAIQTLDRQTQDG